MTKKTENLQLKMVLTAIIIQPIILGIFHYFDPMEWWLHIIIFLTGIFTSYTGAMFAEKNEDLFVK